MRTADLFAGIGGFTLAAEWMGWTPLWVAEIEPYACAVLARQFPHVPNLGDVRGIHVPAGSVDVLTGGFPCQDISLIGRGAGLAGERSGLWREFARIIGEAAPRYVVIENVAALRTRGLDVVLHDLSSLGYDAEWHCVPASYVGAPHRRDRVWIIAHPRVGDGGGARLEGYAGHGRVAQWPAALGSTGAASLPRRGHPFGRWQSDADVLRVANGIPSRVDRIRCVGNAIVPQVAYLIFRAIAAYDTGTTQASA